MAKKAAKQEAAPWEEYQEQAAEVKASPAGPWDEYKEEDSPWEEYAQGEEPKEEFERLGPVTGAVAQFNDLMSWGHGPHLAAGVEEVAEKLGLTEEKPFVERRDLYRKQIDQAKADHPISSGIGTAAGVVGGLVTNPLGKLAGKLPNSWSRAVGETIAGLAYMYGQNPGDEEGKIDPIAHDKRMEMLKAPLPFTEDVPILQDIPAAYLNGLPLVTRVAGMGGRAERAAAKSFGPTSKEVEKSIARPQSIKAETNLGREALDQGIVRAWSNAEKLYNGARKRANEAGEKIGNLIEKANELISHDNFVKTKVADKLGKNSTPNAVSNPLEDIANMNAAASSGTQLEFPNLATKVFKSLRDRVIDGFELTASKNRVLKNVSGTHPKRKLIEGQVEEYFEILKKEWGQNTPPNFKELQRIRGEIQDTIKYDRNMKAIRPGQEEAAEAILKEIDRAQMAELKALEGVKGVDPATLKQLRKDYTISNTLSDRALRQFSKEEAKKLSLNSPLPYLGIMTGAMMKPDSAAPALALGALGLGAASGQLNAGAKFYSTMANMMNNSAPRINTAPALLSTMSQPEPMQDGFPVRKLLPLTSDDRRMFLHQHIDNSSMPPTEKARRKNMLEKGYEVLD